MAKSNKPDAKSPSPAPAPAPPGSTWSRLLNHFPLAALLLILAGILGALFWKSFLPGMVVFSNDASYGFISAAAAQPPDCFSGIWWDLNWLGAEYVTPSLSLSAFFRVVFGLTGFAKFYPALALLTAGLGAGYCCWKLRLAPAACVLAGLAAGLNMDFFSNAAWGVAAQVIGFAACYFAIGLLVDTTSRPRGVRLALAGLAVGFGVVEAFDIGAIFSVYIAAFLIYHALFLTEGPAGPGPRLTAGFTRLTVLAVFAVFIATHALSTLVGTQIKGIAGTDEDRKAKEAAWSFATQWSVPKAEGLQLIVPGLYGFRMNWPLYDADQPENDRYWGGVGRDPRIPEIQEMAKGVDAQVRAQAENYLKDPNCMWRFQGNGIYAGAVVFFVGLWAVFQSFRKQGSPFTLFQRRAIRFWTVAAVISLLLGFGKHAPFYQIFYYGVPYAHTIRNPIKFFHVLNWILVILFAYGVHGLTVGWLQNPVARVSGVMAQFSNWRNKAAGFDRKWMTGCICALGAALLAFLLYAVNNSALTAHLQTIGFSAEEAPGIARFSLFAVGAFVLFLALTCLWFALVLSGQFSSPGARWWAIGLLGALLAVDLGNADRRWIVYWDVNYKYATDDLMQFLSKKPYEQRVTSSPFRLPPRNVDEQRQLALLQNAYGGEQKQNLFLYHNIFCLEIIQEPRLGTDKMNFMKAVSPTSQNDPRPYFRFLELSSTRYLLGQGGELLDRVNRDYNLGTNGFRVVQGYNYVPKRSEPSQYPVDYKAVFDTNGLLAVIEYPTALPRAGLYANWQIITNDDETLKMLPSPAFDPHQTVLVADPIPASAPAATNQSAGTVQIKPNYKPKRIELDADVKTPAVLLLTDRFNARWHATVDGKPEKVLRCNYVERGVYLPQPGKHTIVFEFEPSIKTLWVNAAADGLGVLLCLMLAVPFLRWLKGALASGKTA